MLTHLLLLSQKRLLPFLPALLFLSPLLLCSPAAVHAQWEPDVRLTFNAAPSLLSNNNARCLAAWGDTVHVVWYDQRDGNWEIYYKRSTDAGTTWSQDTRLTADSASSQSPSLAVSGSNVHLVWQDNRNGNWEIFYKHSTDGGSTWGSDIHLTDTIPSVTPSIVALDTMVHVVWSGGDSSKIIYKRSTNGGISWAPDTSLPSSGVKPCIAVSDTMLQLVYKRYYDLYYNRSSDMGLTWSTEMLFKRAIINPPFQVEDLGIPSVFGAGSKVHVAWAKMNYGMHGDFDGSICYKRSRDNGSSWSDSSILAALPSHYFWDPSIYASDSIVHVVWSDDRNSTFAEIYYRRSHDEGTNWEPETRLTYDSARSWSPFIVAQGEKVHVVWGDKRDGNDEIYYKRNLTGNGVEQPLTYQPINSPTPFATVRPNPFTSFAMVPGHSSGRFALYDISGRKVGIYKGDKIGWDVSPGIYFLRPDTRPPQPDTRILRIVKLK